MTTPVADLDPVLVGRTLGPPSARRSPRHYRDGAAALAAAALIFSVNCNADTASPSEGSAGGKAGASGANGGSAGEMAGKPDTGGGGMSGASGAHNDAEAGADANAREAAASNNDGAAEAAVAAADGASALRDSGPSAPCSAGRYAICEDFESTAVGAIPTGWTKHGGQAVVAADDAARGAHALKVSPAVNGERRIYASAAKLKDAHWGRVFYKVQSPAPVSCDSSNSVLHATFVALQGVGPTNGASEYRVVDTVESKDGTHQYLYNVQLNGSQSNKSEFGKGGQYTWKFDGKWHCVEWFLDSGNQAYRMYVDGAEDRSVAVANGANNFKNSDIPSTFSEIKIGLYNYQQACSPYLTAWIDELAVDSARIGCE